MTAGKNLQSLAISYSAPETAAAAFLPRRLLVGLQDFQLLTRLQRVAPFFYLVRRARCRFQAFVKLAITGFNHGLMQVALGKIAGEIVCGQRRRQKARLLYRRFAI